MNEGNLIKRIKQIAEQVEVLETVEMDDVMRKELIEKNNTLKKYYIRKLKDLKWNFLLNGGDIRDVINIKDNDSTGNTIKPRLDTSKARQA